MSGFDGRFGGFIAMDADEKVLGVWEPVYQYILDNPSDACHTYLFEYLSRNPLAGYYVHAYCKPERGNSKHVQYFE